MRSSRNVFTESCFTEIRIIARTHACVEIVHFPMHHQGLGSMRPQPSAFKVLIMHQVRKCVISTWVGSCFYPIPCKKHQGSHAGIMHFHVFPRTPNLHELCPGHGINALISDEECPDKCRHNIISTPCETTRTQHREMSRNLYTM